MSNEVNIGMPVHFDIAGVPSCQDDRLEGGLNGVDSRALAQRNLDRRGKYTSNSQQLVIWIAYNVLLSLLKAIIKENCFVSLV